MVNTPMIGVPRSLLAKFDVKSATCSLPKTKIQKKGKFISSQSTGTSTGYRSITSLRSATQSVPQDVFPEDPVH